MQIDSVFSGGGVKAYAYIGALQSLEQHHIQIERVAGTSAGAIIAALIAADYSVDELGEIVKELHVNELLDPPSIIDKLPFMKWLAIYFRLGIYKGDLLEQWLSERLTFKGIKTFKDIKDEYLKVIISDLSLGRLIVIPDDLERVYGIDPRYFNVATAVRMSAGFPYVFRPKYIYNKKNHRSIIVDGGLLSNFPLWVFNKTNKRIKRPLLGIQLSESTENQQPQKIKNAVDMMQALVTTMKNAHDSRFINVTEKNNVIFIPVKDVKTTDFSISKETKHELIDLGYKTTNKFLKQWPT